MTNIRRNRNVLIREARLSDADAMVAYVRFLSEERPDTIPHREPPSREDEERFIASATMPERAFIFLAIVDSDVVGQIDVWRGQLTEFQHTGRLFMSVDNRWRGCGIGKQLLSAAVQRARTWDGFCRLELDVVHWNQRAIHLYTAAGFRTEGRRVKAVNLRGQPEDMLLMALTWDPESK